MTCFQCDQSARAVCAFCGRGVCGGHAEVKTLYTGFGRIIRDALLQKGTNAGVIVRDAIWCGTCNVEYQQTY